MAEANQTDKSGQSVAKAGPPLSLNLDPVSATRFLEMFQEILETTLKRMLGEVAGRLSQNTGQEPNESSPSSPKKTGIDLNSMEKLKAADLRVALLIGKTPENSGLLIDAKILAKLLDISNATLYRLQAEEALPAVVQFGRSKNWRLAEILEWIEEGCPPQSVWVHMRRNSSKRKGK